MNVCAAKYSERSVLKDLMLGRRYSEAYSGNNTRSQEKCREKLMFGKFKLHGRFTRPQAESGVTRNF